MTGAWWSQQPAIWTTHPRNSGVRGRVGRSNGLGSCCCCCVCVSYEACPWDTLPTAAECGQQLALLCCSHSTEVSIANDPFPLHVNWCQDCKWPPLPHGSLSREAVRRMAHGSLAPLSVRAEYHLRTTAGRLALLPYTLWIVRAFSLQGCPAGK